MMFQEELTKIRDDYNRWIWVKETLQARLVKAFEKGDKPHIKWAIRQEIEAVTSILVHLDGMRYFYYQRQQSIMTVFTEKNPVQSEWIKAV